MIEPAILHANQPAARFYRGGERIAQFRGHATYAPYTPEDWVGSTTSLFGSPSIGLTSLSSGLLRDAIAAAPEAWLGGPHVARYGTDVRLLVKLLHAGERLPVHVHPDDGFAASRLGRAHGKAEAWYIVDPGEVFLGFVRDVPRDELDDLVHRQDVAGLRGLLHRIEVAAGDTVFVPAGLPHAIGEGVFLVEVQQPEDLSILLEWAGFDLDGAKDGHLGLGFDYALEAVDRAGRQPVDMAALVTRSSGAQSALPRSADAFFRIERASAAHSPLNGFGILVVLDGHGELRGEAQSLPLAAGQTILIPADSTPLGMIGTARGVFCRPPAP